MSPSQHPHQQSPLDALWPRHLAGNALVGLGLGGSLTDFRSRLQQQLDFAAAAAAAAATRSTRSTIEHLVDKIDGVSTSGCSTTSTDVVGANISSGSGSDVCLNSTSSGRRRDGDTAESSRFNGFARRDIDEIANRKSFSAFRLIGGCCDDEIIKHNQGTGDRPSPPRHQDEKPDADNRSRSRTLSYTALNEQLSGIDRHGQSVGGSVSEFDGNGNRCCSVGKDSACDAKYSANEGSVSSTSSLKSIEVNICMHLYTQ